ncbi:MAG: transglycosylase SLT domain-containing protein [Bacteroidota bacterium]
MRQSFQIVALLFISILFASSAPNTSTPIPTKSSKRQVYSDRLAGLDLPLTPSVDAQLQRKIYQYVGRGGSGTELMLGRAELYFPIFEMYLQQFELPVSLKYLPVAESLLRSKAVSSARAAGLWQLMPGTARAYGLRVDNVVDERLNPHRSTEAAMRILRDLYIQFEDWSLVLAAYNSGSGRVRKAIRLAGTHEYSQVKRYLPKETQQYVAAYLAAAYAVNFYGDHGLAPRAGKLNDQPLSYLRVYRELSLRKVARAADIDYRYLRRLNPAYGRGYIPKNRVGHRLCVPKQALYATQRLVWMRDNLVEIQKHKPSKVAYQMASDVGFNPYEWLFGCLPSH